MLNALLLAAAIVNPAPDLAELIARHDDWTARNAPETAFARGDLSAIGRLSDLSLAAYDLRLAWRESFLEDLAALDPAALGPEDRTNVALLREIVGNAVRDHEFSLHLMPMDQRWGPHQWMARLAEGLPFGRRLDYERYAERLAAAPTQLEQSIALMRAGIEAGVTPPRITLSGVPDQLATLLADDGLDALLAPYDQMPSTVLSRDAEQLRTVAANILVPAIRGGLERYRDFVVETYLPACRDTIAAADLPEGAAYYEHQLRKMTTTEMSAQEIFDTGMYEVARIRSEMLLVIARTDFRATHPELAEADDETVFAAFIEWLRTDPRFYPTSAEALLEDYRALCKEIDQHLPSLFRSLPRLPYGVGEIPAFFAPDQTTGYYQPGNLAAGEPGWFMVNTYALDQRPTYEQVALALHEAVPGHHLQIALAQEQDDLPEFRQDAWFTAFGEGWALYAERLGIEMGLYEDPYDDFGRLLFEMWRACRLVVDPGIHAFGWSRERAIDFMRANTALSDLNIATEVDRYIVWPGQAVAYKIGELRIRALRREAEAALGAAFDIRAFHDVVLGAGSVPLPVVEERVRSWVKRKPVGVAYD